MSFTEMKIPGAWVHTPTRFNDLRGHFEEQFKMEEIAQFIYEIGNAIAK
jgi:dTDP-4-dehydrorhamnose 3,5-epimerase-like enzyme